MLVARSLSASVIALAASLACARPPVVAAPVPAPAPTQAPAPTPTAVRAPAPVVAAEQTLADPPIESTTEAPCSKECARAREIAHEGDQRFKIDIDGAIERYERAIQLDPTNHRILWALARAWHKKDEFARVEATLQIAVKIEPNVANYWHLLGEAQFTLARDAAGFERASESLRRCIVEDPALQDCRYRLLLADGRIALENGDDTGYLHALETADAFAGDLHPEHDVVLGAAYAERPARRSDALERLQTFIKRICRGGTAWRFAAECSTAQTLIQRLGAKR